MVVRNGTQRIGPISFGKFTALTGSKISLRVADKLAHIPSHVGYMSASADNIVGHKFVRKYFTPTLPATIISPSTMSKQLRCTRYTSISRFDGGDCCLTLHHCKRSPEDFIFPLTMVWGLLDTGPLIKPDAQHQDESSSASRFWLSCLCPSSSPSSP
jgi:hypothetical protein